MGGVVSSPVDESTKREIEELIKSILGIFTTEYVLQYSLAIILKAKMDAVAEEREYRLQERESSTDNLLTGTMVKEGAVRKNWKKRHFVVRHDYFIDYFDREGGKQMGTIAPAGYTVNTDPNESGLKRLKELAEKMGMDLSALPKLKEYPPFTIELHHNRRRCWYITCANEEEFKKWSEQLKECCRRAYGLKNREFCHERAFNKAIAKTRRKLGRYGWWSYGGSEQQILSDLIVSEIEWGIMGGVYSKITGPWMVRNKVIATISATLETTVMAAVAPSWKAMEETVAALRPKMEPKLAKLGGPLGELEKDLVEKIKDAVMDVVKPAIKDHVAPHLKKPIKVIKKPLAECFTDALGVFSAETGEDKNLADKAAREKAFQRYPNVQYCWAMWEALWKMDVMYPPLYELSNVFPEIWPSSLVWLARDDVRRTLDNALWTFELRCKDAGKEDSLSQEAISEVRDAVSDDFRHDARRQQRETLVNMLKSFIMPRLYSLVGEPCKSLLEPISSTIPDDMKDFVDPDELFDQVLEGLVDETLEAAIGKGKKIKKLSESDEDSS